MRTHDQEGCDLVNRDSTGPLVPDRGLPLTLADRSLHLEGASNTRDAGGYRTTDGHWVRMGVLYRSNDLSLLTEADRANDG